MTASLLKNMVEYCKFMEKKIEQLYMSKDLYNLGHPLIKHRSDKNTYFASKYMIICICGNETDISASHTGVLPLFFVQ